MVFRGALLSDIFKQVRKLTYGVYDFDAVQPVKVMVICEIVKQARVHAVILP